MPPGISASDFYYILPELVLTAGALLVLIADVLLPRGSKLLPAITLLAIGATLSVEAGALVMRVDAEDAETLDRVKDVTGRHLERFGEKDGLAVTWQ